MRDCPRAKSSETQNIPSTDQKLIPAGKDIDAHTREVVANDKMQRPIVSALAKCIRSLHATRNARRFQPVCTTRTVCRSYV